MQKIVFVVATDRNGVIGKDGSLPWKLPADLAHFKRVTLGKPVIMGRKTYESIGKALPGRLNIVLSRDPEFNPNDCVIARSVYEALHATRNASEICVIGGAQIFAAFRDLVGETYKTIVDAAVEGDVRFPDDIKPIAQIEELGSHEADERNQHPMRFLREIYA